MTAEGNAANDELREALARHLFEQQPVFDGLYEHECRDLADTVLALPELAALRAKAAAADRVRHTRDVVASQPWEDWSSAEVVELLDHALDGGPC